jgi:hypothetical protein
MLDLRMRMATPNIGIDKMDSSICKEDSNEDLESPTVIP